MFGGKYKSCETYQGKEEKLLESRVRFYLEKSLHVQKNRWRNWSSYRNGSPCGDPKIIIIARHSGKNDEFIFFL